MAVKFRSSGDAVLAYCTTFSMYITLWNMERQTDTLLVLLYYCDFIYIAQYICFKLKSSWEDFEGDSHDNDHHTAESDDISIGESLPLFTTPISLLPFHTVYRMGLDRGYFYQLVCFLRLLSLYQDGRIHFNADNKNDSTDKQGMRKTSIFYRYVLI